MEKHFTFNERLGIPIPDLNNEWNAYSEQDRLDILFYWEQIRGAIPDRIAELEVIINQKQAELSNESNFPRSCQLNSDIADLASTINDLWLWYRTNQNLSEKIHQ